MVDSVVIRPMLELAEHKALHSDTAWIWYRRRVEWFHHLILAMDGDDHIIGYCAIEKDRLQPHNIVLAALESQRPGAGRALLHELKCRSLTILVESVSEASEAWLRHQGFVEPIIERGQPKEASTDTSRDLFWHRWDDSAYDDTPLAVIWPDSMEIGRMLAQRFGK